MSRTIRTMAHAALWTVVGLIPACGPAPSHEFEDAPPAFDTRLLVGRWALAKAESQSPADATVETVAVDTRFVNDFDGRAWVSTLSFSRKTVAYINTLFRDYDSSKTPYRVTGWEIWERDTDGNGWSTIYEIHKINEDELILGKPPHTSRYVRIDENQYAALLKTVEEIKQKTPPITSIEIIR